MAGLNDGFGDQLNVNEVLANYDGWLHRRAYQLSFNVEDREDVAQEGRIAMWKAIGTWDSDKGALPSWLTTHANYSMKECLSRRFWTGQAKRSPGSGRTAVQQETYSLDKLLESPDGVEHLLEAADMMDAALWAYHQGEIAEALDALSPAQRKYVVLRFWCGVQNGEMKLVYGYDPSALWTSQKNGARLKLRTRLAHLVEA